MALRHATRVDVVAANPIASSTSVPPLSHRLVDVAHVDVVAPTAAPSDASGGGVAGRTGGRVIVALPFYLIPQVAVAALEVARQRVAADRHVAEATVAPVAPVAAVASVAPFPSSAFHARLVVRHSGNG